MAFVIATTALFLAAAAHADGPRIEPAKKSIPAIARIGKVQIGYSTQQDLASRWGVGKTVTGGHPDSGRVWRVKGTSWWITTDGFEYSGRGLVVDRLTLTTRAGFPADAPYTKLAGKDFAWFGEI